MAIFYQRLASTIVEMSPESIEYHIASVMIENIHSIYDISIGKMAELCSVSKSTVSKFVRMLGFEDYMDFKAEAMRQREKEIYNHDKETINITDYIMQNDMNRYLDVLFYDIKQLVAGLDAKKIEQLVTDIHDYKKVAAFGEIYSESAAMNFQYKMSFYHKFIYTTGNDRKQEEYIRCSDEDTLLLIFSNSGRYISMYSSLEGKPLKKCFDKTKAKVVLFTSNREMEKDSRIDLCICWDYVEKVQNHPILYQVLIEQIAIAYQKKYGFPMDLLK